MIIRFQIRSWRFTFTLAPVQEVIGVNSLLPDGNHILMWDFDDMELWAVRIELERVQDTYNLPNIYILSSGKPRHYLAYCFKRCTWQKAVEIIAYTRGIDWVHFKYGVFRSHFTLRVTPKSDRKIKLVRTLLSQEKEDAWIADLKSWVKYQTLPDNYESKLHELKVK